MNAFSAIKYNEHDTIVAESTPRGRGGISVIRISGSESYDIVKKLIKVELPRPNSLKFTRIHSDPDSDHILDDAMVVSYKRPNSYTGEDTIEISTHGNPIIVSSVIASLCKAGARMAEPGEFTMRAFLNDKIDLLQAEAISELIAAKSKAAVEMAYRHLSGSAGGELDRISADVLKLLSNYEAELDFIEEDIELSDQTQNLENAESIINRLKTISDSYHKSKYLREGVKVAIAGAPNVGKSSLFNALIGESRSIIHAHPGTTRDFIEASIMLNGIEFRIFDTAGLRHTEEDVETEGIERARQLVSDSDAVIAMNSYDTARIEASDLKSDGLVIKVFNKTDISSDGRNDDEIGVSVKTNFGLAELFHKLSDFALNYDSSAGFAVIKERQFKLVGKSLEEMNNFKKMTDDRYPTEIIAEHLRNALKYLDELTGKRRSDAVLYEIFSKFCIGK